MGDGRGSDVKSDTAQPQVVSCDVCNVLVCAINSQQSTAAGKRGIRRLLERLWFQILSLYNVSGLIVLRIPQETRSLRFLGGGNSVWMEI